jgi:tetratricopeptide (TPR) repeat protein
MDIRLGVGARWFNQVDSDHLFLGNDLVGGYITSNENSAGGPVDTLDLDIALGYQDPSGLGVEVGFSPMPLESVYVMPLVRLASPGLGSRPVVHTLGAQFGWATITGNSNYYYYYPNNGNSLNSDIQMNTYAVVYRVEEMLNARLSLGLELAYHFVWADANYTHYDSNTFTYTTYQTTFNYSGPSISLTLAAWPMAPFWTARDQAAVDDRQSRREQRLEERLERIEARRGPREDAQDYDSAAEAETAGDACMDKGRFSAAQSAFQQATLLAPSDPQAWRGLANAEYAQGKHARAYTHYKEALRLDPDNQPLRDFVEKLKTRLRQDLDLN